MIPGEILIWQLIIHSWQLSAKQVNSPTAQLAQSVWHTGVLKGWHFFFLCGLRSYQVLLSMTRWVKMRTGSQSLSQLPNFFFIIVFSPCLWWYAAATPSACESLAVLQDLGSSTASWCCTPLQDSRPDSPSCIPSPLEARRLSVAEKKKKRSKPGQPFLEAAVHFSDSHSLSW